MCSFGKLHMPYLVLAHLNVAVMGMTSVCAFATFFRTSFAMFMLMLSGFFSALAANFFTDSQKLMRKLAVSD
jgi:hypothetical protein